MRILRQIIIPGDVISKKNSPKIITFGKRPSIRPSDRYTEYSKNALESIKYCKPLKAEYPILMHFNFFRKTNRAFDYNNLSQGPQDILVTAGIIPEDNMNHVIPVFHGQYAGWQKDKENPRLEITITTRKESDSE